MRGCGAVEETGTLPKKGDYKTIVIKKSPPRGGEVTSGVSRVEREFATYRAIFISHVAPVNRDRPLTTIFREVTWGSFIGPAKEIIHIVLPPV